MWRTYRGARQGSVSCAWVGFVAVWFGSFLEVNVRPTWDAYFLDIAAVVASRSPCVKRQVGAVLVSEDRAILATGYNGPPRGAPHRDETTCVRIGIPSGERADVVCCAHAEMNALVQAARIGVPVKGATLYCTTSPCAWCARSIVNAGVVRVVREGAYADPVAASVFAESNVPVIEMKRSEPAAAGRWGISSVRDYMTNRQRPPWCEGQCVNAPEGEPPYQRTFGMICAGCVRENARQHAAAERLVVIDHGPTPKTPAEHDALEASAAMRAADRATFEPALVQLHKLARCMSLPAGAGMAEISTEIQRLQEQERVLRAVMVHGVSWGEITDAAHACAAALKLTVPVRSWADLFAEIPKHVEMVIGASLDYSAAYRTGEDNGVKAACRALVGVLDGPLEGSGGTFGGAELQALAERLLAVRAELWAAHADLGEKVDELAHAETRAQSLQESFDAMRALMDERTKERDGSANHASKLSDEIQAKENERSQWAANAHASEADLAIQVGRAERAEEAENAATKDLVKTAGKLLALNDEVKALEAWTRHEGSLADGRVADAVLKYANDHERRVITDAEARFTKVLEAIDATIVEALATGSPSTKLAEILADARALIAKVKP